MPTFHPQAEDLVSKVRVQIGKDWTEHSFGRPVPRAEAAQRARQWRLMGDGSGYHIPAIGSEA